MQRVPDFFVQVHCPMCTLFLSREAIDTKVAVWFSSW